MISNKIYIRLSDHRHSEIGTLQYNEELHISHNGKLCFNKINFNGLLDNITLIKGFIKTLL